MKKFLAFLQNRKLRIRTQLLIYCSLFVLMSLFIIGFVSQSVYNSIAVSKIETSAMQTLTSIQSNINSIISNAGDFSKMVLSNNTVQDVLRKNKEDITLDDSRRLNETLRGLLNNMRDITSINIFDQYGNHYFQNSLKLNASIPNPQDSEDYQKIRNLKGGFFLKLDENENRSGAGENTDGDFSNVFLIREINSIVNQKPIGTMVVGISIKSINAAFEQLEKQEGMEFLLFDENNNPIYKNDTKYGDFDYTGFLSVLGSSPYFTKKTIDRRMCYVSYNLIRPYGWKIIGIASFNDIAKDLHFYSFLTLLAVAACGILIFWGVIMISQFITSPIKQLVDEMTNIERGNFHYLNMNIRAKEVDELVNGYNYMLKRIDALVENVISEQRTKRKAELSVLQEQIKPHFLYNTFDAIGALILLKQYDDAYKAILTLGNYYRVSLSRGKVAITLSEEIGLVKNYLFIQKIRYGDLFDVMYDLDEELNDIPILKLTLQPFVENAIYHGIKPSAKKGLIKIKTYRENGVVNISVEDNGVGMEENIQEEIFSDNSAYNKYFGIKGTYDRLKYFYGSDCTIKFSGHIGKGLCVTISIPEESLKSSYESMNPAAS